MKYLIYKITNLLNGKIYIGAHATDNINDSYMGSGVLIGKAIKKYGKINFKKEILFTFDFEKLMWDKERELVNDEFITRSDTYNVCLGGKCSGKLLEKGMIFAKNKEGNILYISTTDERYISGELSMVGSKKGIIRVINESTGEQKEITVDLLPVYVGNGWNPWSAGMSRYISSSGESYYLRTDDPRITEMSLRVWTSGKKVVSSGGGYKWVDVTEEGGDGVNKNKVLCKNKSGNVFLIDKNSKEYLSGEYVGINSGKTGLFDHINKVNYKCVHCGKETTKGNIVRWHNDNCKERGKV